MKAQTCVLRYNISKKAFTFSCLIILCVFSISLATFEGNGKNERWKITQWLNTLTRNVNLFLLCSLHHLFFCRAPLNQQQMAPVPINYFLLLLFFLFHSFHSVDHLQCEFYCRFFFSSLTLCLLSFLPNEAIHTCTHKKTTNKR